MNASLRAQRVWLVLLMPLGIAFFVFAGLCEAVRAFCRMQWCGAVAWYETFRDGVPRS